MSRLFPHIFNSDEKKPPKGFEKFFKKKEKREAEKSGKGIVNFINTNQFRWGRKDRKKEWGKNLEKRPREGGRN